MALCPLMFQKETSRGNPDPDEDLEDVSANQSSQGRDRDDFYYGSPRCPHWAVISKMGSGSAMIPYTGIMALCGGFPGISILSVSILKQSTGEFHGI